MEDEQNMSEEKEEETKFQDLPSEGKITILDTNIKDLSLKGKITIYMMIFSIVMLCVLGVLTVLFQSNFLLILTWLSFYSFYSCLIMSFWTAPEYIRKNKIKNMKDLDTHMQIVNVLIYILVFPIPLFIIAILPTYIPITYTQYFTFLIINFSVVVLLFIYSYRKEPEYWKDEL
jgi:hypothetical protein